MLNHVQRDLLKKHVGPFLFCFFTVMFILLMQFLILHVDKLVGKGLALSIVIELILNNLAYMVVLAVPMAVLVSTLIAFGKFSEWNELTAIRAAGINPFKLIFPVLIAGFFLFLGMTYFSNFVLPEANHKARSLFIDIRMAKPGFDLQEGTFYEGIDGYTFLVQKIDADTDTLRDVTVFQAQVGDRYRAYIRAKTGWLESEDKKTLSLFLNNGSIMRHVPGERRGDETMEKTDFKRYRMSFDLSDLAFSRANPESRTRNDRTMSGQAMLAVVDTLNREKESQYSVLVSKTNQEEVLPFQMENIDRVVPTRNLEQDTLRLYHSTFDPINLIHHPQAQISALNAALNSLNKYRSDLDKYQNDTSWRSLRVAEFLVEIHKKISIPFACVLFVLIGAPIGMLTRKGNLGVAALISSVILTVYFIAIIQGEKFADRMIISPFMGMWAINMFLLLTGLILLLHISTSFSLSNLFRKDE
ncbi:MAG: LptF/LptG family permease [Balneolaceae bacterium]